MAEQVQMKLAGGARITVQAEDTGPVTDGRSVIDGHLPT